MNLREDLLRVIESPPEGVDRVPIAIVDRPLEIYPHSAIAIGEALLLMGRGTPGRRLYIVAPPNDPVSERFEGTCLKWAFDTQDQVRRCRLTADNAAVLRELLEWTRPRVLGLADSFGLGDRLGIAGPAHLRAMAGSGFEVVLAQQSIRELERTARTPNEVMDAATWAVFQEGWRSGFGADADHLKTPADVELMADAGFTMFTIDPGDHVVDAADEMSECRAPGGGRRSALDGALRDPRGRPFEICRTAVRDRIGAGARAHHRRGSPRAGQVQRSAGPRRRDGATHRRGDGGAAVRSRGFGRRNRLGHEPFRTLSGGLGAHTVGGEVDRSGAAFRRRLRKGDRLSRRSRCFQDRVPQAPRHRRDLRPLQDQHPLGQRQVRGLSHHRRDRIGWGSRQDRRHELPRGATSGRGLRSGALPRDPRFRALALRARAADLPRLGRSRAGARCDHA